MSVAEISHFSTRAKVGSHIQGVRAAAALGKQALLAAEQAARENFARRMGYAPSPFAMGGLGQGELRGVTGREGGAAVA